MTDQNRPFMELICQGGPRDGNSVPVDPAFEYIDLEDLTATPFGNSDPAPIARYVRYRVSELTSGVKVLVYDGEAA